MFSCDFCVFCGKFDVILYGMVLATNGQEIGVYVSSNRR
jgi:hypothetical protein